MLFGDKFPGYSGLRWVKALLDGRIGAKEAVGALLGRPQRGVRSVGPLAGECVTMSARRPTLLTF